jgi:cytoskeletal protein RodZ
VKLKSLPVIGAGVGAVLTLGIGGALASGAIGGQVQPTSDESVYVAPTETAAATTTDAPAAVTEVPATTTQVPIAPPAVEVPAATVAAVTEPAPAAEPEIVDPESIGTTGADGNYTPAPAPNGVPYLPLPPAPKIPGEPGYVPPAAD